MSKYDNAQPWRKLSMPMCHYVISNAMFSVIPIKLLIFVMYWILRLRYYLYILLLYL